MRFIYLCFVVLFVVACSKKTEVALEKENKGWSQADQLRINQNHESPRMRYKLIQSKVRTPDDIWKSVQSDMGNFSEADYNRLMPLIYEKTIPKIQRSVKSGKLTYEELTKWYIYRIMRYESNPETALYGVISILGDAIQTARLRDQDKSKMEHPIYGMPILLKDNINATGVPTTAGAILLEKNYAQDATIVEHLKKNGAVILGKVNLSEWAYYFCDGCPLGYSAIGGQTLNPYGRFKFETGGSSSGSGVTMAANYAVAAVGTETAGSIISPSSQNSIIGLKPTVGLLSRNGIVPISGTLDTPGPMTRTIVDNAILLSAMLGKDDRDPVTEMAPDQMDLLTDMNNVKLQDLRLGANTRFLEMDSLYRLTVEMLKSKGATIIEYIPGEVKLDGFIEVLNYDMQRDLPVYLKYQAGEKIQRMSVGDIILYNDQDSLLRAPYGQGRFIASRDDRTSPAIMDTIKARLEADTRAHYDELFEKHQLDAILSINNYESAMTAVAKYPCLSMPMGYTHEGEPKALTFIGQRFKEKELLQAGRAFEKAFDLRKTPEGF